MMIIKLLIVSVLWAIFWLYILGGIAFVEPEILNEPIPDDVIFAYTWPNLFQIRF